MYLLAFHFHFQMSLSLYKSANNFFRFVAKSEQFYNHTACEKIIRIVKKNILDKVFRD